MDLLHSGRYVYFGLVWCRMKVLRQALEKKFLPNMILTQERNRVVRILSSLEYLKVYTAILDASTFIESTMRFPICLGLVCGFPNVIMLFYKAIGFARQKDVAVYLLMSFYQCFQVMLLLCLPGFATECISSEVDKIKLLLVHRIVDTFESQDPEHQEIEQFLQYAESRPYKYSVWGLFDVGPGLFLGFASLSITYLIVVIQFTHLL